MQSIGICFTDALHRGALQRAIAAPRSGEAEDVHLARERPDERALRIVEEELVVPHAPLRIVPVGGAERDEIIVREGGVVL